MSMVVPTAAELNTLDDMRSGVAMTTWYMRLFASSVTINSATTLAALLAAEATFTGYVKAALSTWAAASLDGSNAAASLNTQGQFTPTSGGGSGNLYGYFLTDSGGTKLYGAETFSGAPITVAQSVVLEVDLTYTLLSRY